MANFFVEIWESVFTPGTNPALIKATHASFIALSISLIWMVYTSGSIHFFNLLVISLLLWATVTWFLAELEKEKAKLKTNEELAQENSESISEEQQEEKIEENEEKKEK